MSHAAPVEPPPRPEDAPAAAAALPPKPSRLRHAFAVVALLAAGGIAAYVGIATKQEAVAEPPEVEPTAVRVVRVAFGPRSATVEAQGTVEAPSVVSFAAEVTGRVTAVGDGFVDGAFFETGDVLLEIDRRDYELAVVSARAAVAEARAALQSEEAEAEVARAEWAELGEGDPPPLAAREPQLARARAGLESAEASLARAELDLERTRVTAPFDGRVQARSVSLGATARSGEPVATLLSTDRVEVALPLATDRLAHLELPLEPGSTRRPAVTLRATVGGEALTWTGAIERTAATLDRKSRMLNAIAVVHDPYARRPPLLPGLFVEATIEGRDYERVASLPREAVRSGEVAWVVEDGRLYVREVTVLRRVGEEAWITAGLEEGALVVTDPLDLVVDGMRVTPVEPDAPAAPAADDGAATAALGGAR